MIGLHHSSVDGVKENYECLLAHGVTKAEIEYAYWQTKNISWPDFVFDWAVRVRKGAK